MIKIIFTFVLLVSLSANAFTLGANLPSLKGWQAKLLQFKLNASNCPSNIGEILNAATAAWNNVATSSLTLEMSGVSTTTPAQIAAGTAPDGPVITCDTAFAATTGYNANVTTGVGYFNYVLPGGVITTGGVIINVQAGATANITNLTTAQAAIVLAHEIGHVLGFGHSADTKALMYYSIGQKTSINLAQDDIDALTYLYPRDEISGDKLLGCGSIATLGANNNSGSSGPLAFATAAMLLPLLVALWLRKKPVSQF